jgi:YVTN family beta-propeller protein
VAVDTKTGKKTASTNLDELPTDFFFDEHEEGLIFVYGGRNRVKETKRENATLELFDAATLESRKKFDLPGPVTGIYLDAPGYIYLANRGIDRKSEKKQAEGEIYVVNRETLEMETVPIEMAPGPLAWDENRGVYYVLTAPRRTRMDFNAQLHLISGAGIESTLDLPQLPIAMQPSLDREAYFILYKDHVIKADKNLDSSERAMSLDKLPAQLFEHPTNNHFYVLHQAASKVSIVDGQSGETVSTFKSGSAGKKFGKFMAAFGAQLAMTTLVFAAGPSFTVGGTAYYHVPNVVPQGYFLQETFAAFSEDARFLYVYNTGTNDVTVLDTSSHEVLRKVPGGRSDFMTVLDGRYLCTVSPRNVRFFDVDNKFADKATYDASDASILEIPGTTKAYLSRGTKLPVGVIDFAHLGGMVELSGVTGQVVHLVDYD